MSSTPKLSVVIPVFNEKSTLLELVKRVESVEIDPRIPRDLAVAKLAEQAVIDAGCEAFHALAVLLQVEAHRRAGIVAPHAAATA